MLQCLWSHSQGNLPFSLQFHFTIANANAKAILFLLFICAVFRRTFSSLWTAVEWLNPVRARKFCYSWKVVLDCTLLCICGNHYYTIWFFSYFIHLLSNEYIEVLSMWLNYYNLKRVFLLFVVTKAILLLVLRSNWGNILGLEGSRMCDNLGMIGYSLHSTILHFTCYCSLPLLDHLWILTKIWRPTIFG